MALVGRPNAGKSTLMNRLLGEKLAIVSDKPQTTRHRLVGILTEKRGQMVFWDTPGIHRPLHRLNRQMLRASLKALEEADVVCLLVDASVPSGAGDRYLLELMQRVRGPRIAVLNKVDSVHKPKLLPRMALYGDSGCFDEIVPISALDGDGTELLLELLWRRLPPGQPLYDGELLTLHPDRFLAAELVREKVLMYTREELPFTTAVLVEGWQEREPAPGAEEGSGERPGAVRIWASILVERPGQKGILVGKGGAMIKRIGTAARRDLEELLGRPVRLELNVRHEPGWRENRRLLAEMESELVAASLAEPD